MEMSLFVSHSLLYFPSPCLKMFGCRMFGTQTVMGMVGPLFSQGRLMIGRLRWWSILCSRSKPLGCKGRTKIEWFERLQRVVISQSSRFILFWSLKTLICSLMIVFWRVNVPPKVAFFAWEASWGKTLTLEQLQRRGYSMANRYFLCLSEVETVNHLLLHCVKTRVLWNLLFSLFGVAWVLSCSVKETLLGWHGAFVGKTRKKA